MNKNLVLFGIAILMLFSLAACREDESVGEFYSLQEAYDNKLLTVQDLMSIAYYHGSLGGVSGDFIPTPKESEILDAELSNKIRNVFFELYVEPHVDEYDIVTINDVEVSVYYGTYNSAVAVMMKDNFGSAGAIREIIVADITFTYNSGNDIIIWK